MGRAKTKPTTARVMDVVTAAGRPQTLGEIARAIGPSVERSEIRAAVTELTELGSLYPCPRHRYWDRDEAKTHFEHAMARIAERPHTRAELAEALLRLGTGASSTWRRQVVKQVAASEGVYRWPRLGSARQERLSTQAPAPEAFLAHLRGPFEEVAAALESVGVSTHDIVEAMVGERMPAPAPAEAAAPVEAPAPVQDRPPRSVPVPEPADEAERDFHREVAQELVFAWEDTQDATARRALEQVMHNIGIRPLGEVGEEVSFDGTRHASNEGLWPEDPARVEQVGWELQRGTRSRVLTKATVRAVGALS